MKRTLSLVLVAVLALLPACMKLSVGNTVNADGSGDMEMSLGYKLDTVEMLKGMVEGQMGEEGGEGEDPFAKMDEMFDEKKIKESMTKAGMNDVTTKIEEKDGWKMMTVKGKIKSYDEMMKKATDSEEVKKAKADDPEAGAMMDKIMGGSFGFFKTDKEDVVKMSLIPPIGDLLPGGEENPLEKLDEMDEDQRAMIEQQMEQMRAMFALDQMKVEMRVRLPGEIIDAQGVKKDEKDANVATWTLKGADVGLDSVKSMFGMKNGLWVKFKKPANFGITLKEEKKAESKPVGGTTPKSPEKKSGEEEKKKKEDG